MIAEIGQTRELIRRCLQLREAHVSEAVLRIEIVSRLRLVFTQPEDESWINHYSRGTEARTSVRLTTGATARRFIDNLVGSTTIEYEADLRIPAKKLEGCGQVKEHVAGLIQSGSPTIPGPRCSFRHSRVVCIRCRFGIRHPNPVLHRRRCDPDTDRFSPA